MLDVNLDINLNTIRRDYGSLTLSESDLLRQDGEPLSLFREWLELAISTQLMDPTAFVLSSVDESGQPDSRVVLLKEITNDALLFFTHYNSQKGIQFLNCKKVALNFYWRELSRQVRIKGTIEKASRCEAENYFSTRPLESQISAIVSHQSKAISDRESLLSAYQMLKDEINVNKNSLKCPENWGGYYITPFEFEFFQGRDKRLHDRIKCTKDISRDISRDITSEWSTIRLSP